MTRTAGRSSSSVRRALRLGSRRAPRSLGRVSPAEDWPRADWRAESGQHDAAAAVDQPSDRAVDGTGGDLLQRHQRASGRRATCSPSAPPSRRPKPRRANRGAFQAGRRLVRRPPDGSAGRRAQSHCPQASRRHLPTPRRAGHRTSAAARRSGGRPPRPIGGTLQSHGEYLDRCPGPFGHVALLEARIPGDQEAAIRGFCVEFARQENATIDFISSGVPTHLPPDVSKCLFRVLQKRCATRSNTAASGTPRHSCREHPPWSCSRSGIAVEGSSPSARCAVTVWA